MKIKFTKKKPTKAGWYVVRYERDDQPGIYSFPEIVRIIKKDGELRAYAKYTSSASLSEIGEDEEWCKIKIGD